MTSEMLLPAKAEVARHLELYRAWERMMLAAPADRAARGNFEDTGYTLCVLMGKRCAREAVHAAERYLSVGPGARRRNRARVGPADGRRSAKSGRSGRSDGLAASPVA